jgi:putative oxidoreductase
MRLISLVRTDMPQAFDGAASLFQLVIRVYVSWVFLKSGYLKLRDWDSTLALFEYEYRVPLLSPHVAAVLGTFGEILFPVLLIIGLFGRLSALGVFLVNVLAVVSYQHVLLQDGFEAAIGQHYLWGLMLTMLVIYGPGKLSADAVLMRRPSPTAVLATSPWRERC